MTKKWNYKKDYDCKRRKKAVKTLKRLKISAALPIKRQIFSSLLTHNHSIWNKKGKCAIFCQWKQKKSIRMKMKWRMVFFSTGLWWILEDILASSTDKLRILQHVEFFCRIFPFFLLTKKPNTLKVNTNILDYSSFDWNAHVCSISFAMPSWPSQSSIYSKRQPQPFFYFFRLWNKIYLCAMDSYACILPSNRYNFVCLHPKQNLFEWVGRTRIPKNRAQSRISMCAFDVFHILSGLIAHVCHLEICRFLTQAAFVLGMPSCPMIRVVIDFLTMEKTAHTHIHVCSSVSVSFCKERKQTTSDSLCQHVQNCLLFCTF